MSVLGEIGLGERFRFGVNLSGAEHDTRNLPGDYVTNYEYPSAGTIDAYAAAGCSLVRLPFRWERLQRRLFADFDLVERQRLIGAVDAATRRGLLVVLDPHNYAGYRLWYGDGQGHKIGTEAVPVDAFADFWGRLAPDFADNPAVLFGLMNEPQGIGIGPWRDAAQAAIDAIRATGAGNLILAPSTDWTGGHSWFKNDKHAVLATLRDPAGRMAWEAHQYLDSDNSGTHPTVVSPVIGPERLARLTEWARARGEMVFLGETNAGDRNALDRASAPWRALTGLMDYLLANRDVWLGAALWCSSHRTPPGYFFRTDPDDPRLVEALARVRATDPALGDRGDAADGLDPAIRVAIDEGLARAFRRGRGVF
ncbi:MAG: glycoside hydrolase family 5 protein [Azospirillaceae bacterium]